MWRVRSGQRYYYRSGKVAGQTRWIYVGTGPVAELAAAEDECRRIERQVARQQRRTDQAGAAAVQEQLDALDAAVTLLTRASLLAAGFHRHKREWRRYARPTHL